MAWLKMPRHVIAQELTYVQHIKTFKHTRQRKKQLNKQGKLTNEIQPH